MRRILLQREEIDISFFKSLLGDETSGAQVWFVGTVRKDADCADLLYLEYEAYEEMARRILEEIVLDAARRWNLAGWLVVHRLGRVPVGEASLLLGVSAAHRAEAFDGCRHLLERLKAEVPIWKKEVGERGERWKANEEAPSGEGTTPPRP
jgi:molybdopterin synthase catalytic subunit